MVRVDGTPELEVLLCCARPHIDAQATARLQSLLSAGIDWSTLNQLATCHGLQPLLYKTLKTTGSHCVPPTILQDLQDQFHRNARHSLILTKALLEALALLQAHGIPAIPFKGPSLAAIAYGNLLQRQFIDLDILVHPSDLAAASDRLIANGYHLHEQTPVAWTLTSSTGAHSIDLHRALVPQRIHCTWPMDELWQDLVPVELMHQTVFSFSPEITLLLLCIQGSKDLWTKLNRISDIAALLCNYPQLNWTQLTAQAQKRGCVRILGLGLYLARTGLGATVPEPIWEQIQSDPMIPALAAQLYQQLPSTHKLRLKGPERTAFLLQEKLKWGAFYLKVRENWWDRYRSIFNIWVYVITPNWLDRAFIKLPQSLSWLYYGVRPIRVLKDLSQGVMQPSSQLGEANFPSDSTDKESQDKESQDKESQDKESQDKESQ